MRFLPVLLIVTLLPVSQATDWSDGGSGGDVSGSESTPYLIAPGSYAGRLPAGDVDWYTSPSGASPTCARFDAVNDGGSAMLTQLVVGGTRATTDFAAGESRSLSVAGMGDSARMMFANAGSGQTKYLFSYSSLRAGESNGDAGTGTDAPNSTFGAPTIGPGCIGGSLGGVSPFDARDVFKFTASASDIGVLTLASNVPTGVRIDLTRANGQLLGAVMPGESLKLSMPATETYYITASAIDLQSSQYVMGLTLAPPGQGCRPMCMG